eukprot:16427703-Heterocapsa_arctica.AAC.1
MRNCQQSGGGARHIETTLRNYYVGGNIQPKRDLMRLIKWPKYVSLQRKKNITLMRIKMLLALIQFNMSFDKNQASLLLCLPKQYLSGIRAEKKKRLMEMAEQKKEGEE